MEARSVAAFAYTTRRGDTYYLHAARFTFPDGRATSHYYFAPCVHPERAVAVCPPDYVPVESPRARPPFLRKARGAQARSLSQ
jgi:hypothetical protein